MSRHLTRCHSGDTYVIPNGPAHRNPFAVETPGRVPAVFNDDRQARSEESWAVLCFHCDRVLAVVDCPREEVYAEL